MSRADVVIVGAGASGLAVAAALKRSGIDAVLLDRDSRVGGTWARRYERLHLHTVKRFSGLPYKPIPAAEPRYVPTQRYAQYLSDYAAALGLDVRLGNDVQRVSRDGRDWVVALGGDGASAAAREWRARAVVIATGRHREPRLPTWPGEREFRGQILHSHEYRSGRAFAGKRALVIGIGNSGAEIATDLVEGGAASVTIAVRTPPPITAREIAGIPVQLLGIFFKPFPPRFVDWLGRGLRRIGTGDLSRHGLGQERWGPFTARRPPVIDVGFLEQLEAGRIAVRPDVARFTPTSAVFTDGTHLEVDAVVVATGYTTGLDAMVAVDGALDERGFPLPAVTSHAGLFFAGYAESPRGQLFESARAAPRLARDIERYLRSGAVPPRD